jgi:transposase
MRLAEYKDKALALVLDNAAYQRWGKVTEYAKEQGIGLIFLPPYSPNLNLYRGILESGESESA